MTEQIDEVLAIPYDAYPGAGYLSRPEEPLPDKPLVLIREALLFNEEAYRTLRSHASPFGRGALLLLIIVAFVVIARAIGLAFGLLTFPRIDILQSSLYEFITQMGLYTRRVAAVPEFAQQFRLIYEGIWQAVRLAGGYPSWTGTVAAAVGAVAGTYLNWLVFGLLTHLTARWFRGQASLSQFFGPLALSYAPLLLTVVLLVPGASVAMPFIFLALLVAKYQAVKTTYGLAPFAGLAAILIPYLLITLLMVGLAIFGAAYGLSQIPYLEPVIRVLQFIGMF